VKQFGKDLYVIGSQLDSERGFPAGLWEMPYPFPYPFLGANKKPQWIIRENPNYQVGQEIEQRYFLEEKPLSLTSEELALQQKAAEDAALFKPDTIRLLQEKIAELENRLTKVEEGKI
jgi:hypothetical protein